MSGIDLIRRHQKHRNSRRNRRMHALVALCVGAIALIAYGAASAVRSYRKAQSVTSQGGVFTAASHTASSRTSAVSDTSVPNPALAASSLPTLNPLIPTPTISAQSALVFELNGPVLYSENPDVKVPIASLTKLMTALIVMQDPRHAEPITITAADHVNISPILRLQTGDEVYPDDLIHAMLVGSANDAALTLANHFATTNQTFIQRMNAEAQTLGMSDTSFSTPIGFDDPQNYSTARDLRKLIDAALNVLPFAQTDQADSYTFDAISNAGASKKPNATHPTIYTINATSHLPLNDPTISVLKTGFTDDAKQAMVASTKVQDKLVISIVLQSDNRDQDSATLLHYVSQAYIWPSQ